MGFININFDGASKGNPGPVGFRTICRDSNGEILHFVAGFLGKNTNNAAELLSPIDNHFQRVIVEGVSRIIIQLITKLLHGDHPTEISPSWRLSGLLEDFGSLLCLVLPLSHLT